MISGCHLQRHYWHPPELSRESMLTRHYGPLKLDSQTTPMIISTTNCKSSRCSNIKTSDSTTTSLSSQSSSLAASMLLTYLIRPIGLDTTEEKNVVKTLFVAKLFLHILLRPRILVKDISSALSNPCHWYKADSN